MKARFNLFLGTLIVFGISQAASAADATWTGLGADSLWTTTGNWSTSPVPGAGNTATFNGAGNGKTTITTAPAALNSYIFDTGSAAYTISASTTTWSVPNGGGVTINSGVSATQDLSGIQFIRPVSGSTTNFVNSGSGLLKLGTIFNSNASSPATGNALLRFAPASGATIEIISGKTVDNASTAGRTVSILLDDAGILKMAATGGFSGTDADGNSVTIRQGTLQANTIINASATKSSLGTAGRIQFGKASTTNTATLDYYNATSTTTDRAFYIIDNNTAVFKVSGGASTNLAITTAITQSATTNGGGNLTKDGVGILTLSAANTFTGDTLISNGKIALGITTALQNSAYDTTGSTGAIGLDVTGFATPTLGGIKGGVNLATAVTGYGSVTNLTLNPQTGKSNTYTGIIADGASGMTLTKSGAGTQVLSGDNSFTGNVTVSAGTLKLTHSNALGLGTKGLQMQGTGRVLELSNNITLGSNITLNVSSNTGDGLGVSNVDGTNEIQGQVNISTGNPAMNISSAAGTLTISGNVTLTATTRTLYLGGASANANTISGIIGETGGVLPVTKQGTGTWVLTNANTYTGVTNVNAGKLIVNGNQTSATGATTVAAGTVTAIPVAILGGNGTIGGNVVLTAESSSGFKNGGVLAPTAAVSGTKLSVTGTTAFGAGSIFQWDMSASDPATDPGIDTENSGSYGQLAGTGTISGTNAVFKIILGSGNAFSDTFWNTNKTWNDVFSGDGATASLTSIFSSIGGTGITYNSELGRGDVDTRGYFTLNGSTTLTWTAVPEPTSALAGLLVAAGLLRRRRA